MCTGSKVHSSTSFPFHLTVRFVVAAVGVGSSREWHSSACFCFKRVLLNYCLAIQRPTASPVFNCPITAIFVFYDRILFTSSVPEIGGMTKKAVKSSVALIFPNERDFLCMTACTPDRNCSKQTKSGSVACGKSL